MTPPAEPTKPERDPETVAWLRTPLRDWKGATSLPEAIRELERLCTFWEQDGASDRYTPHRHKGALRLCLQQLQALTAPKPDQDAGLIAAGTAYPGDDHLRGCPGREFECTCGHLDRTDNLVVNLTNRLALRDRQIAGLVEALRPFIEAWTAHDAGYGYAVTEANFRAAARAVRSLEMEG